jgi:hypothetical protein
MESVNIEGIFNCLRFNHNLTNIIDPFLRMSGSPKGTAKVPQENAATI